MPIILHIDVNNAFLSWTAAQRLRQGAAVDLRTIPSVVGGDVELRRGVVLAKSAPAKRFGVVTGESLYEAKRKYPDLVIVPPDHGLYREQSDRMFRLLCAYSPVIQRFSIDECYLEWSPSDGDRPLAQALAEEIRLKVSEELGFTVNIGVSVNRLLAKMGSEMEKPDRVHTLWPEEIPQKLWPLPVERLYMVGAATAKKLRQINLTTVGELAAVNPALLRAMFKSHGQLIWNYANGVDLSPVVAEGREVQKGVSRSTTLAADIVDRGKARRVLLELADEVASDLRRIGRQASVVGVTIRTADFDQYSRQRSAAQPVSDTTEIYRLAGKIFDEAWKKEPIRLLAVSAGQLCEAGICQLSMLDQPERDKREELARTVDAIREKFGRDAIGRGTLRAHSPALHKQVGYGTLNGRLEGRTAPTREGGDCHMPVEAAPRAAAEADEKDRNGGSDRNDRNDRNDRSDGNDGNDRSDGNDRNDRSDRNDRNDGSDGNDRNDGNDGSPGKRRRSCKLR